jgi:hypothetical protein
VEARGAVIRLYFWWGVGTSALSPLQNNNSQKTDCHALLTMSLEFHA